MAPRTKNLDIEITVGIYLTNESRLYEVIEVNETSIRVSNVVTGTPFWLPRGSLKSYRIVLPEWSDTWDE